VSYRVSVDLPEDPEQRMLIRAKAVSMALEHAVSDPHIRLQMILGEAYQRYRQEVVGYVVREIAKEAPATRALAERIGGRELLPEGVDLDISAVYQNIMADAAKTLLTE